MMHTALLATLALSLAAGPSAFELSPLPGQPNLLALGVPVIPPALAARLDQYQNARGASLLDVASDGAALLVGTRFGSTVQLHVVSQPLGMREQITFGKEPILDARLVPNDPRTVLYLQDVGGGEFYQLYRLDRRTGRSELLTDGRSRHDALLVSRDGRRLAYAGTGRNGRDTDVYVADLARPREARRIVEGEGTFQPLDLSPDGAKLLVTRFRSIADADLRLVDAATGASRLLLEGNGSLRDAVFSADGRAVFAVTDRFGDRNALYRIDLARGDAAPRPVAPGVAGEVEQVTVAPDGRVAFTTNVDGYSLLHLLDPRSGSLTAAAVPPGVAGRLLFPSRRGDRLALSISSSASPSDVHVLDVRTRRLTRWTRSEVGGIDPSVFVEPELVRYPSKDGVEVPAFLYRAPGGGRRPVVVLWHGGPESQFRPSFSPWVQFLAAELGLAVLAPNVRGSDGYGKRYLALDDGVRREQALADVGATFDFVAGRPDLDPARVAVYGGSYGGYMVLASMTFFPERVRAGVDVVGISSLPTFLASTQEYRRDLRRAEYGDERVAEVRAVQERISPLNHVARIAAPLFVVQGKNDPRVPQSEAEQIVKAVRANGKEVWYLLALDEGHGFQKKENRDSMTAAVALFLERMLLGDAAGEGKDGSAAR
jgi:dipeptidyl aminopeptidase/acylaminoacyl peptidase